MERIDHGGVRGRSAPLESVDLIYIYDLYSTLQSAKYNTNKRKKKKKGQTDRYIQ